MSAEGTETEPSLGSQFTRAGIFFQHNKKGRHHHEQTTSHRHPLYAIT